MRTTCILGFWRVSALAATLVATMCCGNAYAEGNPVGVWRIKIDANGHRVTGPKLSFWKKDGGGVAGKFIGTGGETPLSRVVCEGGKLAFSFLEKPGLVYSEVNFEGKVEGDVLKGTFSSDGSQMGVEGTREAGAEASSAGVDDRGPAGDWILKIQTGHSTINTNLSITEKAGGKLAAKWSTPKGEAEFENVKYENGRVSFSTRMKEEGEEFELGFDGKLEADRLIGKFRLQGGVRDAEGVRAETPKMAAEPGGSTAAERAALIGTWELASESTPGTVKGKLTIRENMSGTYEAGDSIGYIKNLKLAPGGTASFDATVVVQGREIPMRFTGKIEGNQFSGECASERDKERVAGKKTAP